MIMDELRITLLGFGSANRALARMLLEKSVRKTASTTTNSSGSSSSNTTTSQVGRRKCLRITEGRYVPWSIVGIITRHHGRVLVPLRTEDDHDMPKDNCWEIDVEMALHRVEAGGILDRSVIITTDYRAHEHDKNNDNNQWHTIISDPMIGGNDEETTALQLISRLGQTQTSNIVVEAIPSNSKGNGEPAISFIAMALESKMHVVSANKIPLAHSCNGHGNGQGNRETYWRLQQLAQCNNVTYQHESSVMDGIPLFSLWKYTLPHANITSIRGCLNSTTTMILSRMEGNIDSNDGGIDTGGESFQDALNAAKEMGIVEEDESLDLDGYDAAVKLRALLVVLSSSQSTSMSTTAKQASLTSCAVPTMDEIPRDSIRNVTHEDIHRAYSNGRKKYRLVATARLLDAPFDNVGQEAGENDAVDFSFVDKRWEVSVQLKQLPPSDPLYNLSGSESAVQFCTDVLGPVTLVSSNPTLMDTAYGLYSDIVRVASNYNAGTIDLLRR